MTALGLVVGRLADIVQQAAAASQRAVQTDLLRHHAGDEGHFNAVPQHVLAVAGAEMQPAQQVDQPLMQTADGQLLAGVLAELLDVLLQLLLRSGDDLFDPRRVNAAVGNERVQGQAGDFPADHVEAADDDYARGVVDDQIDAGGFFEGADVATFSTDDPPLHLVIGNADRAGCRFGGMRGRVTLQRGDDDLAGLLFAGLGQLLVVAENRRSGLLLELRVEDFQQAPRGLGLAQAAELVQRLPLQIEELRQVFLAVVGLLDLLGEFALSGLDDFFLLANLFGLLFQGILALVEEPLAFVELAADLAKLLFAFVLLLEHQLLDLQLALAAAVFGVLLGLADDLGGLMLGVLAAQVVENPDQKEGHPEGCNSRYDDGDDLLGGCHDDLPRSSRTEGAWQLTAMCATLQASALKVVSKPRPAQAPVTTLQGQVWKRLLMALLSKGYAKP